MPGITYVPLPSSLLVRLVGRYQDHYGGIIEHAVEDFLDRTEEDWQAESDAEARALFTDPQKGYTWDQLTLPHGTELRTKYRREWQVATVSNGAFLYKKKVYPSPSQACNAMRGGTSNNAWITLEIKRPQDVGFRLANTFRRNRMG